MTERNEDFWQCVADNFRRGTPEYEALRSHEHGWTLRQYRDWIESHLDELRAAFPVTDHPSTFSVWREFMAWKRSKDVGEN